MDGVGGAGNSDELRLEMERSLQAEASSGGGANTWMDMNLHSTKNAISQGSFRLNIVQSYPSFVRSFIIVKANNNVPQVY